jgi:hypothetical protein
MIQKISFFLRMSFFYCTFAANFDAKEVIMTATMTQGVYLNIPRTDWVLLQELVSRFGWQSETREQMLEEFMQTRPMNVDLSEEDIMNEVRAVRYA